MRVELTPAVLNDSFEVSGLKDDMGATIRSVRATGVAAEGAEASVGRTFAGAGSCRASVRSRVGLLDGEERHAVDAVVADVFRA